MRLLVDDEPFDVRYGELRSHERVLDLRDGVLRRQVEWFSPAGRGVRITSTRLVSFSQRAIAAVLYEVEPLDEGLRVVVQSELVANEAVPDPDADPRAAAALAKPLVSESHERDGHAVLLAHSTRLSGLRMVAAMDHVFDGPEGISVHAETGDDVARVTATVMLGVRREAPHGEVPLLRMVERPHLPRAAGTGGRRPRRGEGDRLGRDPPGADRLPRRLLEHRRRRDGG